MFKWYVEAIIYLILFFSLSNLVDVLKKKGILKNSRKGMHVLIGTITLIYPVLSMNRSYLGFMVYILLAELQIVNMRWQAYKSKDEGLFYTSTGMKSYGEILYLLSTLILAIVCFGKDTLLFYYPILLLVFSDTSAEVVGMKWGKISLTYGREDKKTLEGFLGCFITSVICGVVCFTIHSGIDTRTIVFILFGALLCACAELISSRGMDNVLILAFSYIAVKTYLMGGIKYLDIILGIVIILAFQWFVSSWIRLTILAKVQLIILNVVLIMSFGLASVLFMIGFCGFAFCVEKYIFKRSIVDNFIGTFSMVATVLALYLIPLIDNQYMLYMITVLMYVVQIIYKFTVGTYEEKEQPGDSNNKMRIAIKRICRGKVVASCILWLKQENQDENETVSCTFGGFMAEEKKEAMKLLQYAESVGCSKGAKYIVGPIDGNTWHSYRCSISNEEKPFFMEDVTPLSYHKWFEQAGYHRDHSYYSSRSLLNEENRKFVEMMQPMKRLLGSKGITIKNAEKYSIYDLMRIMYDISIVAFADNYYFEPISFGTFFEIFQKYKDIIVKKYFFIAYDNGKPIGFLFCVPNHNDNKELKTIIFKTLGILPEYQKQNVGVGLVAHACKVAVDDGMKSVINAYYCKENKKIYDSINSLPIKAKVISEYATYRKELVV